VRRTVAGTACAAVLASCSGDESPGPSGNIDYAGSWTGTIGDVNFLVRRTVRWEATHDGDDVSGPLRYVMDGGALSAGVTLTGTVTGESIFFTLVAPNGAFPAPVAQSCSFAGTGTSEMATENTITVRLQLTFQSSCTGTLTTTNTGTHQLLLTR
jgi:hypothetical protein